MQTIAASPLPASPPVAASAATERGLPWYIFAIVFGAACIPVGALWDISWHSTIGRDTFWTPAHMMIYLGGALPGMCCGWIVLKASFFSTPEQQAGSVRYLGFRGPLGAWVTIWGSLAMLVSAPFDNWWHEAYGLDVEILSPPHTVLAAGMYAVAVGAMLQVLSWQNRASEAASRQGARLFLFAMGVLIVMASIILTEKSYPNHMHAAAFYIVSAATYPFYLALAARSSRTKWGATSAAAVYMAIICAMIWILPLFPGEPLLAPIYLKVTRMVPPVFPLILIVPAIAIDLINRRFGQQSKFWRDWLVAAAFSMAFAILFIAVQWPFSEFLLSPGADNWFFAGKRQWPYFIKASEFRGVFWNLTKDPLNGVAIAKILAIGFIASRLGLAMGGWMAKVRR